MTEHQLEIMPLPKRPRIEFGTSLMRRLISRAEVLTGLPHGDLLKPNRSRTHSYTRWAVMKVAFDFGRPICVIARNLKLNHSSVCHGLERAGDLNKGNYIDDSRSSR